VIQWQREGQKPGRPPFSNSPPCMTDPSPTRVQLPARAHQPSTVALYRPLKGSEAAGKRAANSLTACSRRWIGPAITAWRPPRANCCRRMPTFSARRAAHYAGINTFMKAALHRRRGTASGDFLYVAILGVPTIPAPPTAAPAPASGRRHFAVSSGPLHALQLREWAVDLRESISAFCDVGDIFNDFPANERKEFRSDLQGCGPRVSAVAPFRSSSAAITRSVFHRARRLPPSGRQKGGIIHFDPSCRHPGDDLDESACTPPLVQCHQHGQRAAPRTWWQLGIGGWQVPRARGEGPAVSAAPTAHRHRHLRHGLGGRLPSSRRARHRRTELRLQSPLISTASDVPPVFRAWYRLGLSPAACWPRGP